MNSPGSPDVHHRFLLIDGHQIFYREAGDPAAPTLLLLHGAPASSFMFRSLMPLLAENYHVIAPDYLGFGLSESPPVEEFNYTFDPLGRDSQHFHCNIARSRADDTPSACPDERPG